MPSRPWPDCFAPPYGIWSTRNVLASLTISAPTSRRSNARLTIRRSFVNSPAWRPNPTRVGEGDRLVDVGVRRERRRSARRPPPCRRVLLRAPRAGSARRTVPSRVAAAHDRGTGGRRVLDQLHRLLGGGFVDEPADVVPSSSGFPIVSPEIRVDRRLAERVDTRRGRTARWTEMHACPARRKPPKAQRSAA